MVQSLAFFCLDFLKTHRCTEQYLVILDNDVAHRCTSAAVLFSVAAIMRARFNRRNGSWWIDAPAVAQDAVLCGRVNLFSLIEVGCGNQFVELAVVEQFPDKGMIF